jgi:hypothetical protein
VPSEHSTQATRRQGAINKADSPLARRMLVPALGMFEPVMRGLAWLRRPAAGRKPHLRLAITDTRFKRPALAPT